MTLLPAELVTQQRSELGTCQAGTT